MATVCMLWGVVLFGYILGSLASSLTNADAQRSRYIHRLNTIREHLKEAGVSEPLKRKVLGYYEYLVWVFISTQRSLAILILIPQLHPSPHPILSKPYYRSLYILVKFAQQ